MRSTIVRLAGRNGSRGPGHAGTYPASLERLATAYEIHAAEQYAAAFRDLAAVQTGEARRIIRVLTRGSQK